MMKFTMTDDTITIIDRGEPHVVRADEATFEKVRDALFRRDHDEVLALVSPARGIERWSSGRFRVAHGCVVHGDQPLPDSLSGRILAMARDGSDPSALMRFWEKLQLNPSHRSVQQLFSFLEHEGIPLTSDGDILAYKSVRSDYKDHHSNMFSNAPGTTNEMPRNRVSDDPNVACDEGFHVGSLAYAKDFNSSGRLVLCRIDPADVVSVPSDSDAQKMRVCRYEVVADHDGRMLPSTVCDRFMPKKAERVKGSRHAFDGMDRDELMSQTLRELREYASKSLRIIGASRIPGGKFDLVDRIIDVRFAADL